MIAGLRARLHDLRVRWQVQHELDLIEQWPTDCPECKARVGQPCIVPPEIYAVLRVARGAYPVGYRCPLRERPSG